jgi:hypothetical protein
MLDLDNVKEEEFSVTLFFYDFSKHTEVTNAFEQNEEIVEKLFRKLGQILSHRNQPEIISNVLKILCQLYATLSKWFINFIRNETKIEILRELFKGLTKIFILICVDF